MEEIIESSKTRDYYTAMIVSDRYDYCWQFLQRYNLDPRNFILCTCYERAMGVRRDIPVIITYHGWNDKFKELHNAVTNRFINIRFIDY